LSEKQHYSWQDTAVSRFWKSVISAVIADCGTGKTLVGILLAEKKNLPTLIIAPTHTVCRQWKEEIEEYFGDEADVWLYNSTEQNKDKEAYLTRFAQWLQEGGPYE